MNNTRSKKVLTISFVVIIVAIVVVGYRLNSGITPPTVENGQINQPTKIEVTNKEVINENERIIRNGVITEVKNNTPVDGNCEVKVENDWIIVEYGGERVPGKPLPISGSTEGIKCDLNINQYVGKQIDVYGKWNGYSIDLIGKSEYYARIKS